MTESGEFGMWLAFGAAGVTAIITVIRPIGLALARRISGGRGADGTVGLTTGEMTAERMTALEDRINELEHERAGLEERLEFAERMLSRDQAEPRAALPGGAG